MLKCCRCKATIIGFGHNPEPLVNWGRCCDKCNNDVIRYRLYKLGIKYTGYGEHIQKEK